MADFENPEEDPQGPGVNPYQAALQGTTSDVSEDEALQLALGNPVKPKRNSGAPVSSLWERFKTESNFVMPALRGVTKAINSTSDAIVGTAVAASKKTNAYKLGRDEKEEAAFLKAWEQPIDEANPLRIGTDADVDQWLGQKKDGLAGMAESMTQFATGWVGGSKLLGAPKIVGAVRAAAAAKGAATVTKVANAAINAGKGFAVDAFVFDPEDERLSDSFKGTPILGMLAHADDDGQLEGRFKNAMEGLILGSSIDLVIGRVKATKLFRKGDKAGAEKVMEETLDKVDATKATEPLHVVELSGGKHGVIINEAMLPEIVAKDAPTPGLVSGGKQVAGGGIEVVPGGPAAKNGRAQLAQEAQTEAEKRFEAWARKDPRAAVALTREEATDRVTLFRKRVEEEQRAATGVNRLDLTADTHAKDLAGITPKPEKSMIEIVSSVTGKRVMKPAPTISVFGDVPKMIGRSPVAVYATKEEAEAVAATASRVFKSEVLHEGVKPADPSIVKEFVENHKSLTDLTDPRSVRQILDHTGINVSYIDSPEDALNAWVSVIDAAPDATRIARGKTKSWAETANGALGRLAGTINEEARAASGLTGHTDGNRLGQLAQNLWGSTTNLDEKLTAVRAGIAKFSEEELLPAAKAVLLAGDPEANPQAFEELTKKVGFLHDISSILSGAKADVGRALNANKIRVGGQSLEKTAAGELAGGATKAAGEGIAETAEQAVKKLTAPELRALAGVLQHTDGDPDAILKALRGTMKEQEVAAVDKSWHQKARDVSISYKMEAMLSGPRTHLTNALSNTLVMVTRPAEYMLGGIMTNNPELRKMGSDMIANAALAEDLRESWKVLRMTFAEGHNFLDPTDPHGVGKLSSWDSIKGQDTIFGQVKALGSMVLPSRFLMASDEFFKSMNYRMGMRARILRKARAEGVTDAGELAKRLNDEMQFIYTGKGEAVNPWALQYARVSTFTNELEYGLGKSAQELVTKHPMLRHVMPFVRTPVNIFRYAHQRAPVVGLFQKEMLADLRSGDPERRAVAIAKATVGTMTWITAYQLAEAGKLTGGGPRDPKLRKQWRDAGNQPYSVTVGGKQYSLRRADPIFTAAGIVADVASLSGELENDEKANIAAVYASSIARNVMNKSFMQGVADFFDAVSSDNPHKMEALFSTTVGAYIPNAMRQMDPNMTIMETRGIADEMLARIPGYSETLEPRRNFLGEKALRAESYWNASANPVTTMSVPKDENVAVELLKLSRAFPTPSTSRGGVDLTDRELFTDRPRGDGQNQSPYDRMLEIMAEPANGMPPLREALERLVANPSYKNATSSTDVVEGGMKYQLAVRTIKKYQTYAFRQMLTEYPSVQKELVKNKALTRASLAGGQDAVDRIEALFQEQ